MQLYNPDTTPLIDVEVTDESYAYKQIMSRDDLTLYFSLTSYIEMPIDMYCVFQNMMYYLTDESNFTQHGSRNFEYTLKLDAPVAYMKKTKFKFVTLDKEPDGSIKLNAPAKTKFSLRGTPSDFLDMLVDCMNYNDKSGGWTKGECIEGEDLLMDINDLFCYEFLGQLADKYKTEFDVVGKTMHLKKVENKNLPPIPLAYGKGNGLLYGLERKIYKTPVSRVWIESSDRNIDYKSYGADTLRLPKNRTIVYEGIEYITDATGSYVERKVPLRDTTVPPEATLDVTEIYPSHEGTISSVEAIDDSKGLYAFIDIDNVIDYNKVAIAGETATIIFQTGELAGSEKEYEFAYDHTRKRFRIKPITDNGLVYPQGTIIPAVGDKYAVFHIKLPQEYIDEAQEKALNEVVPFLYENEQPQYTYSAPIDQKYAKENWGIIGDRLKVGYFIRLSDEQYLPEGADIRITAVTTFVNKPRMPKIELSNSVTRTSLNTEINKIDNQEQTVDRKQQETYRVIKRTWANVQELINAMYDPSGSFQEQILSSVVLHAMMGVFGDETLQYQFLFEDWQTVIEPVFSFDPETRKFHAPVSRVRHMTMGIDSVQPDRPESQYKHWQVSEYLSDVLSDTEKGYYLYMQCSKDLVDVNGRQQGTGQFLISETKIALEDVPGMYTFWVGFLSSENDEGDRSLRTVYGFTEILPGQMTVDNIFSSDGLSYWKLIANQFKIPGLDWNVTDPETLTLTNAVVNETLRVKGSAEIAGFRFFNDRIESISETVFNYEDWITGEPVSEVYPSIELIGRDGESKIKMRSVVKSWSPTQDREINTLQELIIDSKDGSVSLVNGFNKAFMNSSGLDVVSSGIDLGNKRSAVLGRGVGSLDADPETDACLVGVRGFAANGKSDGAPAYGGYFDALRVNGLILKVRQVSGTTDQNTQLITTDTYVFSDSEVQQTVILPIYDVYTGRKIEFKQWKSGFIRLQPPAGQKLYDDSTENTYIDISEGETATVVCVGEKRIGDNNYKVWLLSKYKF